MAAEPWPNDKQGNGWLPTKRVSRSVGWWMGEGGIDTTLFNGCVIVPLDGKGYTPGCPYGVWCLATASSMPIQPHAAKMSATPPASQGLCTDRGLYQKLNPKEEDSQICILK